jgi:hypothetical protein
MRFEADFSYTAALLDNWEKILNIAGRLENAKGGGYIKQQFFQWLEGGFR